jgi:inorganic pyrophosphatase
MDRVLYCQFQISLDYAAPNTLADDGDPVDGMVIMDQPTFSRLLIPSRPIGMLIMIDGGDRDEKILCVPAKDPRYTDVKTLADIASSSRGKKLLNFSLLQNHRKVTEIRAEGVQKQF